MSRIVTRINVNEANSDQTSMNATVDWKDTDVCLTTSLQIIGPSQEGKGLEGQLLSQRIQEEPRLHTS